MKPARVSTVLIVVILAISLFFFVSLFSSLTPDTSSRAMNKWIDVLLNWTFLLLIIGALAILSLELAHAISDKKAGRKALIFIGSLGAVFLLSLLLSDSELPQFNGVDKFIANGTLTPAISHCIGACLITAYILIAVAIIGIVYSYIYQLFN